MKTADELCGVEGMCKVPSSAARSISEQVIHDRVVGMVAASRFNLDGWVVDTNPGTGPEGVPDIVATNLGEPAALGEVETLATLSDAEALQWKAFGDSCPRFYLFVPEGGEQTAVELIERHGVACAGLRCYSIVGEELQFRSVEFKNGRSPEDSHPWWISLGKE